MTERATRGRRPPAAERPRGRGTRAVGEMMPEIGGAAFRRFGFVQSAVVSRWAEIVGPRYADACAPESIRFPAGTRERGVLTLAAASGHAAVLQHVAPTIIERVNRFFGYPAVERVVIRQGMAPVPRTRPAPGPRAVPTELGDSLRTIADPELRACLAGLAGALAASTAPAATPPVAALPILGKVR